MIKILNAFLGNKSGRDVKALTPTLIKIKEAYKTISQLSNDELRAKTQEFKKQIADYIADKENNINDIKKNIELEEDIEEREKMWEVVDKLDKEEQIKVIKQESMTNVYELERQMIWVITGIELNGFYFDTE